MNTSDTSSQKSAEKDELAPPLDKSDKNTLSIQELQNKVDSLKEEKRRAYFAYLLFLLILLDFVLFREVGNWAGAIVIGVLQFILILFIGQILEIKTVDSLVKKILDAVSSRKKKKNKNSD